MQTSKSSRVQSKTTSHITPAALSCTTRMVSVAVGLIAGLFLSIAPVRDSNAFGPKPYHKLGVYSLKTYGVGQSLEHYYNPGDNLCGPGHPIPSTGWKTQLESSQSEDPYQLFWTNMTGCTLEGCAHQNSRRFENSEVVHSNIVGSNGFVMDNWNDFDLVLFHGHNNTIASRGASANWHYYLPFPAYCYENGIFVFYTRMVMFYNNSLNGWGTNATVNGYEFAYSYYRGSWVTDAGSNPGVVVYLYNPWTSLLLGRDDFRTDLTSHLYKNEWDGPDLSYPDQGLGAGGNSLKWLVLNGCQSVVVRDMSGDYFSSQGIDAYSKAWKKLHMVLGHNIPVSGTGDLNSFANKLRNNVPVKVAYFDIDGLASASDGKTSAISAEDESSRTCWWVNFYGLWIWVCAIDPDETYMETDTWKTPMADTNVTWFYTQYYEDIT